MTLILTVVHILVCIALVFVVLVQRGSGADMGSAFGGSSQSLFGARGSGSFLGKLTAVLATVFMLTSLTLAFFSSQRGEAKSVMEGTAPVQQETIPAPPKDVPLVIPAKGGQSPAGEAQSVPVSPESTPAAPVVPSESAPVVPAAPSESVPVAPVVPSQESLPVEHKPTPEARLPVPSAPQEEAVVPAETAPQSSAPAIGESAPEHGNAKAKAKAKAKGKSEKSE